MNNVVHKIHIPALLKIQLFLHRFDGVAPEPRKGLRSGHIPGSKCIPFPEVYILILGPLSILKKYVFISRNRKRENLE